MADPHATGDTRQTQERLAQAFHEAYERLAPSFGYETRPESAVLWEDVPENNRALMEAVVAEVVVPLVESLTRERDEARDDLRKAERALSHAGRGQKDNDKRITALTQDLADARHAETSWHEAYKGSRDLFEQQARDLADTREALWTIADHPIISESEFPEDNCDWHCTAEMVATADAALAARPEREHADDLCAHGCGMEATVQHADGSSLCLYCYHAAVGLLPRPPHDCPTCAPAREAASADTPTGMCVCGKAMRQSGDRTYPVIADDCPVHSPSGTHREADE